MVYLDFEKPLEGMFEQLEQLVELSEKGDVDTSEAIKELKGKIKKKQKEVYTDLTPWQKVQVSRHPQRPYSLFYIQRMFKKATELHGDRLSADDKAMVGFLANFDGQTVVVIGQQKGATTKERQYRNFGMANPEGYRKALRLMKLAEKFNFPVITLVDTPGAFCGLEAEEHGQASAIAQNMMEMAQLRVPIISVIIGEGASGGAIGLALADKVFMMEYTWFTVISPESCSSILWRSWEYKETAADLLKLTSDDMLSFGLIDGIIKEPVGGAHFAQAAAATAVKKAIKEALVEFVDMDPDERIEKRINKYCDMGRYLEDGVEQS